MSLHDRTHDHVDFKSLYDDNQFFHATNNDEVLRRNDANHPILNVGMNDDINHVHSKFN